MKRILVLLLCVMLLFGGCADNTVELPLSRPDDFAIYYRWGYSSANFFDTYEGKIGKDLITAGSAESALAVSEEMLDEIYALIVEYDIASIKVEMTSENLANLWESRYDMIPCASYEIRFRADGTEYTVIGDATAEGYKKGENFCAFVDEMTELVRSTPEYLAFPEAEGGYM